MTVFLFILSVVFAAGLVVSASLMPHRSRLSRFELERRRRDGDVSAALDERRESLYADIVSVQRVVQAMLLVAFVLSIVGTFGWFLGGVVALVVSLGYGRLSATGPVRRWGVRLYDAYEPVILARISQHHDIVRWVRAAVPASERRRIESRQELEHLVTDSPGVLTDDETKLILASLKFDDRTVSEIMTPKSVVDTIKRTEVLGPLVLDDLHKTGHSRFPVIDEDIDHIVGILYVRDVLTLDTTKQRTSKVETAMSKRVYYIRDDHTLTQALSGFLRTHHHLFVVINEFRETVGIITLEDTLEALLGRRIVDEFDAHDDMRAVALRNASTKTAPNRSADSKDI